MKIGSTRLAIFFYLFPILVFVGSASLVESGEDKPVISPFKSAYGDGSCSNLPLPSISNISDNAGLLYTGENEKKESGQWVFPVQKDSLSWYTLIENKEPDHDKENNKRFDYNVTLVSQPEKIEPGDIYFSVAEKEDLKGISWVFENLPVGKYIKLSFLIPSLLRASSDGIDWESSNINNYPVFDNTFYKVKLSWKGNNRNINSMLKLNDDIPGNILSLSENFYVKSDTLTVTFVGSQHIQRVNRIKSKYYIPPAQITVLDKISNTFPLISTDGDDNIIFHTFYAPGKDGKWVAKCEAFKTRGSKPYPASLPKEIKNKFQPITFWSSVLEKEKLVGYTNTGGLLQQPFLVEYLDKGKKESGVVVPFQDGKIYVLNAKDGKKILEHDIKSELSDKVSSLAVDGKIFIVSHGNKSLLSMSVAENQVNEDNHFYDIPEAEIEKIVAFQYKPIDSDHMQWCLAILDANNTIHLVNVSNGDHIKSVNLVQKKVHARILMLTAYKNRSIFCLDELGGAYSIPLENIAALNDTLESNWNIFSEESMSNLKNERDTIKDDYDKNLLRIVGLEYVNNISEKDENSRLVLGANIYVASDMENDDSKPELKESSVLINLSWFKKKMLFYEPVFFLDNNSHGSTEIMRHSLRLINYGDETKLLFSTKGNVLFNYAIKLDKLKDTKNEDLNIWHATKLLPSSAIKLNGISCGGYTNDALICFAAEDGELEVVANSDLAEVAKEIDRTAVHNGYRPLPGRRIDKAITPKISFKVKVITPMSYINREHSPIDKTEFRYGEPICLCLTPESKLYLANVKFSFGAGAKNALRRTRLVYWGVYYPTYTKQQKDTPGKKSLIVRYAVPRGLPGTYRCGIDFEFLNPIEFEDVKYKEEVIKKDNDKNELFIKLENQSGNKLISGDFIIKNNSISLMMDRLFLFPRNNSDLFSLSCFLENNKCMFQKPDGYDDIKNRNEKIVPTAIEPYISADKCGFYERLGREIPQFRKVESGSLFTPTVLDRDSTKKYMEEGNVSTDLAASSMKLNFIANISTNTPAGDYLGNYKFALSDAMNTVMGTSDGVKKSLIVVIKNHEIPKYSIMPIDSFNGLKNPANWRINRIGNVDVQGDVYINLEYSSGIKFESIRFSLPDSGRVSWIDNDYILLPRGKYRVDYSLCSTDNSLCSTDSRNPTLGSGSKWFNCDGIYDANLILEDNPTLKVNKFELKNDGLYEIEVEEDKEDNTTFKLQVKGLRKISRIAVEKKDDEVFFLAISGIKNNSNIEGIYLFPWLYKKDSKVVDIDKGIVTVLSIKENIGSKSDLVMRLSGDHLYLCYSYLPPVAEPQISNALQYRVAKINLGQKKPTLSKDESLNATTGEFNLKKCFAVSGKACFTIGEKSYIVK